MILGPRQTFSLASRGNFFRSFSHSIDTGTIVADISGSYWDHTWCVEEELISNYDIRGSVDDEVGSNCDTCLIKNESVRLDGMNYYYSIILYP